MGLAFHMTVDTAIKFYELCVERKAETEEARIAILLEMQAQLTNIVEFKGTPDEYSAHLAKNFKVADVRRKESEL
jgi:hypothetical protein